MALDILLVSNLFLFLALTFESKVVFEVIETLDFLKDSKVKHLKLAKHPLINQLIPQLSLTRLESGEKISTSELIGGSFAFVFLTESVIDELQKPQLNGLLIGLKNRIEGRVYLICSANKDGCRSLKYSISPYLLSSEGIHLVHDESGTITRELKIMHSPSAMICDRDGRIIKYGKQLTTAHMQSNHLKVSVLSNGGNK